MYSTSVRLASDTRADRSTTSNPLPGEQDDAGLLGESEEELGAQVLFDEPGFEVRTIKLASELLEIDQRVLVDIIVAALEIYSGAPVQRLVAVPDELLGCVLVALEPVHQSVQSEE